MDDMGFLLDMDEIKELLLVAMEWRSRSFERNLQKTQAHLMNEEITTVGIFGLGGQNTEVLLPEDIEQLEMHDCYDMGSCLSKTFLQLKFIHNKGFINCKIVNYKGIRWILKLTFLSTTANGGQMTKKQKGQVNQIKEDQADVYVKKVNMENDDTSLDQPIGGLISNARCHRKQRRINVHELHLDYGAITVVVAQAFQ
ncbi:hypothetical protein ACH5RR_041311 [Cinchona calisaya]|uniref:Uncharacterized protein n=1 Tax=Cinchona calisaya TaxID=153742 RepID=A0ABD2XWI0_9GENT